MPLATKLTGGAALVLLSLIPNHHKTDGFMDERELKTDPAVLVSSNRNQCRLQASYLAQPVDEAKLKQKKALSKAIRTLRGGEELSFGQSVNLVNNFKSYKASEMIKFMMQAQRDINNSESRLYKRLSSQSRSHLSQHMTPFLNTILERAGQNNGKIKFICADLSALQTFNELQPKQKAIILGEFRNHAFPKSTPSRNHLIALNH